MFEQRSYELEIIDTEDYTPEEYNRFLREIRFINRWLGDVNALKQTLWSEIARQRLTDFSVLDVGAGSGELLRQLNGWAKKNKSRARLTGLELNARSAQAMLEESQGLENIRAVRGDALRLPFADDSFDYVFCSLFTHHFTDENVVLILREMSRVARHRIYVIDLHRNPMAYRGYKLFSFVFSLGRLSKNDGALSVLRGFTATELVALGEKASLNDVSVSKHTPARLVLTGKGERRKPEGESG